MSDRRERLETERSVAEAEPKGTSYEVKDKRLSHPRWTVTGDVSSVSRPSSPSFPSTPHPFPSPHLRFGSGRYGSEE